MENTYAKDLIYPKTISPLQYVKVLIIFHLATIFTVIIDFIPCDIYSYTPKTIHPVLKELDFLFTFKIPCGMTSTIISSILVVWTFITAIIIFYMGKKENLYCGMRVWDIVSHNLSKKIKVFIVLLFFCELFLILAASMLDLPVTLAYFSVLYTLTSIFTFWFISWATSEQTIQNEYFLLITDEYTHITILTNDSFEKQLPVLSQFIHTLSFSVEKELDTLREIILTIYLPYCQNSNDKVQQEYKKSLYLVLLKIRNVLESDACTNNFFRSLAKSAYDILKEDPNATDILSAMSFPLLTSSMYDAAHYINFVSVIPENAMRNELILRGAVYTVYLDKKTSSNKYVFARNDILSYYTTSSEQEFRISIINFAEKMNAADPENNITADIFEKILNR